MVEWGEWGACAEGVRTRSKEVKTQAVGAGDDCEELVSEQEGEIFHTSL